MFYCWQRDTYSLSQFTNTSLHRILEFAKNVICFTVGQRFCCHPRVLQFPGTSYCRKHFTVDTAKRQFTKWGWFAEHITGCFTFNALIHSLRALHLYKELLAVYVLGNRILPPNLFAELLSDTKALNGRPERRHWAGYPRFTQETGAQREEGTCLGYMVRWGQRWFPGSSLSRAVPLPDPA